MEENKGRVAKEHIQRTCGQSQKGRMEGGRWGGMGQGQNVGGEMETTVLEQQ